MPIPVSPKPYAFKDKVEITIDQFAALENPTQGDLNYVKAVAQVEQQLGLYRKRGDGLEEEILEEEEHQSKILAAFMAASGDPRPSKLCHAHAIVSGAHKDAAELRATIAWLKLRIDDPHNGCWLPRNTAAKAEMPKRLRNAIPHSRIHRYNYYFWLNRVINPVATNTRKKLVEVLNMVELRLQAGKTPPYVMSKKGEGLPA